MPTLVAVVAHPDDDAYGIAGTVALHADEPGFRFVLVHATEGEGGDIRPGFDATPETLGRIRRAEDEAAWRAVGRVPDRHEWLGLPDGGVADVPFDDLVDRLWAVLDEEQPDLVFTFGPDGIFGHPDHVAVGAATDAAFARGVAQAEARGGPRTAFRRLVHGAIPESVFQRWNAQRQAMGLTVFDPTQTYQMRGVPDEQIGIEVDLRPVARAVVAGLREHRSQHHVFIDDPDDIPRWERIMSGEWHVVAWPAERRETRLRDMLEGLGEDQPHAR
ncbi:N-acetylglucosaminyl deacetylase, LmbE family [Pedococcus dokdonensis]|uniref:N-acetylglucosaminyl deacetylase, LmbE family n=1 Tax=Pedococcus dokdonensis TaxID=443156 RepID=A0A1H0PFG2_9MICO|nr:PIG-L family deacetylase [Pedococcus dokdonensis]SDP03398.1 N-acetylglucosaminyl deacetylase, LmbE family [Pedococcus dokdonensis]